MVEGHRWPGAEVDGVPRRAPRRYNERRTWSGRLRTRRPTLGASATAPRLTFSGVRVARSLPQRARDGADARAQQLLRRQFRTHVGVALPARPGRSKTWRTFAARRQQVVPALDMVARACEATHDHALHTRSSSSMIGVHFPRPRPSAPRAATSAAAARNSPPCGPSARRRRTRRLLRRRPRLAPLLLHGGGARRPRDQVARLPRARRDHARMNATRPSMSVTLWPSTPTAMPSSNNARISSSNVARPSSGSMPASTDMAPARCLNVALLVVWTQAREGRRTSPTSTLTEPPGSRPLPSSVYCAVKCGNARNVSRSASTYWGGSACAKNQVQGIARAAVRPVHGDSVRWASLSIVRHVLSRAPLPI